MIDRFERFSLSIAEISRCWHKIASDAMEEYGLKGVYSVYFVVLYRYPQGLTAAQLGELCGRDKADVSRAVSLMEKQGLLQRIPNGGTGYRAALLLTERGQEVAEGISEKARAAVECASRGLPEEKRVVFHEALELICHNLLALSKDGLGR